MQVSKALTFVLCFIPLLTCECSRTAAPSSPPAEDRTLMLRSGIRAASSAEERRKEAAPLNEPDLVNDEELLKEVPCWFLTTTVGPLPLPSPPPSDRPGGLPGLSHARAGTDKARSGKESTRSASAAPR